MTEKDIYKNGVAVLEEWEDVNYCEHTFKFKDEWLTDKEVVDLLNALHEENKELKKILGISENDNIKDIVEVLNLQQTEIWNVKRENEQLKKELTHLKYRFFEYRNKIKSLPKDEVEETLQKHYDKSKEYNHIDTERYYIGMEITKKIANELGVELND